MQCSYAVFIRPCLGQYRVHVFVSLYCIRHVFVSSVENSQACVCEFRRDLCIVLGEVGIEFRFLPRLRLAPTPVVWFSLSGSD